MSFVFYDGDNDDLFFMMVTMVPLFSVMVTMVIGAGCLILFSMMVTMMICFFYDGDNGLICFL